MQNELGRQLLKAQKLISQTETTRGATYDHRH